jgi:archaellin
MSQFDLTTTELVKAYLGITNTTYDTIIDTIVTQTSCEMEIYCNRQFELDTYIEQGIGNGETTIRLPNTPVDSVLFSAFGTTGAIDVTFDASTGVGNVDVQDKRVVLTSGLTTETVTILSTHTMTDVANSITALTNWTATAEPNLSEYPGLTLVQQRYNVLEEDQSVSITSVSGSFRMVRESDGRYRVPQMGKSTYGVATDYYSTSPDSTDAAVPGTPSSVLPYQPLLDGPVWMVIYQGGYAVEDIPEGLQQLATEIAANVFRGISKDTSMESEKIGDYSYKLASNSGGDVRSAIYAQSERLDFYTFKVI